MNSTNSLREQGCHKMIFQADRCPKPGESELLCSLPFRHLAPAVHIQRALWVPTIDLNARPVPCLFRGRISLFVNKQGGPRSSPRESGKIQTPVACTGWCNYFRTWHHRPSTKTQKPENKKDKKNTSPVSDQLADLEPSF